jgi:uncharacterized protein
MRTVMKRLTVVLGRVFAFGLILAGALASVGPGWSQTGQSQQLRKVAVTLGNKVVLASIADTEEARLQGLLGWETITDQQGMLLDFINESDYAIHMQGMKFPIDAVWIDGKGEIKAVYRNIQPNSGKIYLSKGTVRYCLEIQAGMCEKSGVEVGRKVTFGPPPPEKAPETGDKPNK